MPVATSIKTRWYSTGIGRIHHLVNKWMKLDNNHMLRMNLTLTDYCQIF